VNTHGIIGASLRGAGIRLPQKKTNNRYTRNISNHTGGGRGVASLMVKRPIFAIRNLSLLLREKLGGVQTAAAAVGIVVVVVVVVAARVVVVVVVGVGVGVGVGR